MTKWIGAAMLALTLMLGSSAAMNPAAATALSQASVQKPESSQATDLGARRRYRHHDRYGYRPSYRPYYYDRPSYYRPYPYSAPVPFLFGFGFGPWW